MKHIIKAAFLAAGLGLLMTFAYNLKQPHSFFDNAARTTYFAGTILMIFAAMSMKNVLAYKTKSQIQFNPKYQELKTSGLSAIVVLLFILSPTFDQPAIYGICNCQWIRWIGCLFLIDAVTFFTWSSWVLGKTFFRNDNKPAQLQIVTSGPYAVIRYPRYLGLIAWGVSTALVFNNLISLLLAVMLVWVIVLKIGDEETFMELEFGEDWLRYKKHTYRILPMIY